MERTHLPSAEHTEFDHFCERLDDFEPLPEPQLERPEQWSLEENADSPLDGQILAGLVTPV